MRISQQTVYIDANACPVKGEIEELCQKYNRKPVFVESYAHMIKREGQG